MKLNIFKKIFNRKIVKYLMFIPTTTFFVSLLFLVYLTGLLLNVLLFDSDLQDFDREVSFIVQEEKNEKEITKYEKAIAEILEIQANDETTWDSYKNIKYGYEFKYPKGLNVRELPFKACVGENCLERGDVAVINAMNISAYFSDMEPSLAYSKGLDKEEYKEPVETNIGGIRFYYIIKKDGKITNLVHEYKYLDDLLWVKDEYKIEKGCKSYYISFGESILPIEIDENQIDDLNKAFNTFKF